MATNAPGYEFLAKLAVWLESPASLAHAGYLAPRRKLPETDSADAEFPQVAAGPPTELAAIVLPNRKLRFSIAFFY